MMDVDAFDDSYIIKVQSLDAKLEIDLDLADPASRTGRAILSELSRSDLPEFNPEHVQLEFDRANPDEDSILDPDHEVDFEDEEFQSSKLLLLKYKLVDVQFSHLHFNHDFFDQRIDTTIGKLRADFLTRYGSEIGSDGKRIRVEVVSWKGRQMDDRERLLNFLSADDIAHGKVTVFGKRTVQIADRACDFTKAVEIFDFQTTADLVKEYLDQTGRIQHDHIALYYNDNELVIGHRGPEDAIYQVLSSVEGYEDGQDELGEFEFEHVDPGYPIYLELERKSESVTLNILDSWTIRQIKEAYSRQPNAQLLSEDDVLQYDMHDLKDDDRAYQYKLRSGAHVVISTSHVGNSVRTAYLCTKCRAKTQLKSTDRVMCNECGNAIVYKVRTSQPVQYLCI